MTFKQEILMLVREIETIAVHRATAKMLDNEERYQELLSLSFELNRTLTTKLNSTLG